MTLFSVFKLEAGPKHSTNVSSSMGVALPLRVDEKEVAFVPNSGPGVAVKAVAEPQGPGVLAILCPKRHELPPPPTLQNVVPVTSLTVQLKEKVSPGQVGGAGVNCPATSPGENTKMYTHLVYPIVACISCSLRLT